MRFTRNTFCLLYTSGYELTTAEVKELVDDGTIQDIKAAHGDPNRVHELKYHMGDKINVFYGHDYCAMEGILALSLIHI